jgi:hypothetical protein
VVVKEEEKDGAAEVIWTFDSEGPCIRWKVRTNLFGFLKSTANADGAFLLGGSGDAFEAHICECKRTITLESWRQAKLQMRWTLAWLLALAGAAGIQIDRVTCYTAYRDDEAMRPDSSPDPAQAKLPIDPEAPRTPEEEEIRQTLRQQFDWIEDRIRLRDLEGAFPHVTVLLDVGEDDVGRARIHLAAPG